MPATNVKSTWSSGNLYFTTNAGSSILQIDGTNRIADVYAIKINGTSVTASATELNKLASVTAGSVTASSAVVVGASREIATLGPITGDGDVAISKTITSATPATDRLVHSAVTITPATTAAIGSNGSIVGVRGAVTLSSGKSLTDGYLYGVQGKLMLYGTVVVGSDMCYGVMGQLDLTGATITSGYVAGVGADIFGVSSGTVACNLFNGQHADGGTINAHLASYGKATYVFDFNSNGGPCIVGTGGTYSSADGYLAVNINGSAMRIPYFAGVD